MPDYGQTTDKLQLIPKGTSTGISLIRSGSLRNHITAISASTPSIIAVTCSANINNRLTSPTNTNAYGIITVSSGSNVIKPIRLVLTYVSSSFKADFTGSVLSTEESLFDINNLSYTSSNYTKDRIVSIPILNNDDSFIIAAKTVKAIKNTGGYGTIFSASLVDDGSEIANLTGSVGSMAIGTTLKIRNSASADGSEGKFLVYSLRSGSVAAPDFAGTAVQLGDMDVGGSFKIGGADPVFTFSIVQSGSGQANQSFYPGDYHPNSSSLIIEMDSDDKTSAYISSSGNSLLYFSSSGNIGIGTTNPQKTLDVLGDANIQGTLTSREFHTELVSSSIIYESGSTLFGNSSDDVHTFTGSVNISGDISLLDINARNITASGNISASGDLSTFGEVVHLEGTDPRLKLKAKGANHPGVEWHEDSTRKWVLYNDPDESDSLVFKNDTTEFVKISQTGNISSSLTSTGSFGRLEATSLTASIGEFDADTITIGGTIINKTIADNVRALLGTDAKTMAGNRVVISGPGGDIIASSISATELAYLGNVTSDIQSQLDSLAVTGSSVTFTNITASGNISASGEIIGTINGGSF